MSLRLNAFNKEAVVKNNLMSSLVDCVKEIQLANASKPSLVPLVNDECTNNLCWTLEAMFIHGLKGPFLESMGSVLGMRSKSQKLPEPCFWEYILVYCHKDVIMQINKLALIATDIGRCRAWLRIVLNDGLLSSYLHLMFTDRSTLKAYYKTSAFLSDREKCDIMKNYVIGVETYAFKLAINSSLLNAWNRAPLSLVGICTSFAAPISEGFDVASNMDSEALQGLKKLKEKSKVTPATSRPSFPAGMERMYSAPLLDEDEALKVILSSGRGKSSSPADSSSMRGSPANLESDYFFKPIVKDEETQQESSNNSTLCENNITSNFREAEIEVQAPNENNTPEDTSKCSDNTITYPTLPIDEVKDQAGINVDQKVCPYPLHDNNNIVTSPLRNEESAEHPGEAKEETSTDAADEPNGASANISYAALFRNLAETGRNHNVDTALNDSLEESDTEPQKETTDEVMSPVLPTETINTFRSAALELLNCYSFKMEDEDLLVRWAKEIPQEVGLDYQNFKCQDCDQVIGILHTPRVCYFTGNYYCDSCHLNDYAVIPSRVLLNWDLSKYSVCVKAKQFLEDIDAKPILNIEKINHSLYGEIEELSILKELRKKLHSMYFFLTTCKISAYDKVKESEASFREYYFEEIHSYSMDDLMEVPTHTLETKLKRLVTVSENHINRCLFCYQKGFLCEICKTERVIFPFESKRVYQCPSCGGVYHKQCMDSSKPCPRCKRWKRNSEDSRDFCEQEGSM